MVTAHETVFAFPGLFQLRERNPTPTSLNRRKPDGLMQLEEKLGWLVTCRDSCTPQGLGLVLGC